MVEQKEQNNQSYFTRWNLINRFKQVPETIIHNTYSSSGNNRDSIKVLNWNIAKNNYNSKGALCAATVENLVPKISDQHFTNNNAIELLIDGEQTFSQMLSAIAVAQHYILLQSYIINNDEIGNKFKEALIESG